MNKPEAVDIRDGDNSESYARGQIRKNELNRKIDHEPEGNIGVVCLVLLFFVTEIALAIVKEGGNVMKKNGMEKLMKWVPVVVAGIVAMCQTFMEQQEEARVDRLEERISRLEDKNEDEDEEDA